MPTFTLRIEFDSEDEMTKYLLRDKEKRDHASPLPEHYLKPVGREPIPDLPKLLPFNATKQPMRKGRRTSASWTDEQLACLREFHLSRTARDIASLVERTPAAVSQKLTEMRVSGELPHKYSKRKV